MSDLEVIGGMVFESSVARRLFELKGEEGERGKGKKEGGLGCMLTLPDHAANH